MRMKAIDTLFLAPFCSDILSNLFRLGLDLWVERRLDRLRQCLRVQLLGRHGCGSSTGTIDRVTPELLIAKERDDDAG